MTDPVQAAIDAANQQAQNQPAPTAQAVAPVQATGTPMSLDDLASAGMAADVDDWLKVNEFGLCVKSEPKALFQEVELIIDTSAVQGFEAVKFGNPATYFKTYDGGVSCDAGGSWAEAIVKAKQVKPDVRPYKGADIPFEVIDDVVVDGKTVAEAGDILGYSTSTTAFKNFSKFMKELKKRDQLGATVKVKVTAVSRTNKAGNDWGVLGFEILEILEEA